MLLKVGRYKCKKCDELKNVCVWCGVCLDCKETCNTCKGYKDEKIRRD